MNVNLTIERDDGEILDEIEVECQFYYSPASRGARDSLGGVRGAGPALEPDEPESVTFEKAIKVLTGEEVELTADEIRKAEDKAYEVLGNRDYDGGA